MNFLQMCYLLIFTKIVYKKISKFRKQKIKDFFLIKKYFFSDVGHIQNEVKNLAAY